MRLFYSKFNTCLLCLWDKKVFQLFFFLLFLLPLSEAQIQVKNINTTSGSIPDNMIEMGGYVYFTANNGSTGAELWRSDGTEGGTTLVMDINSGTTGSDITNMVAMNGKIYFKAETVANGEEVWMTDGTTTQILKDINVGSGSSSPTSLYVYNNTLYFSAYEANNGRELWKSNGTAGNATLVMDINPGGAAHSDPTDLYGFDGFVYFAAKNSDGKELWKTDGTTTSQVMDINSGSSNSDPKEFQAFDGDLYFSAKTAAYNRELWKVEGTTGNAALFADIYDGASTSSYGSFPQSLMEFNGHLYFIATNAANGQEIFKTDGTTVSIGAEIKPGTVSSYPMNLIVMGSNLYFVGYKSGQFGRELYQHNGTTTVMLKDVNATGSPGTGDAFSGSATMNSFQVYKDRLFFSADNGVNGDELWMSDGTAAGTVLLRDVNDDGSSPGLSSDPDNLIVANDILFFRANVGVNGTVDKELMQIGNCAAGEVLPYASTEGVHQSLYEKTEGTWTHYCDCQNNILLSVEKDATVDIPTENVSIKISATTASFHDQGCITGDCFITNPQGAVVFNRSWDVDPTTQPAADMAVRFYFTDNEFTALNTVLTNEGLPTLTGVSNMSFFKVTDGTVGAHSDVEDIPAGSAIVLTNGAISTTTWASGGYGSDHYAEMLVSSFSGGGGGGGPGGTALPVELMYFKARPQQENVYLEWSTASEINNEGFIIERSAKGENWDKIDFVVGRGTAATANLYTYIDKDPLIGTSYYRLRQRDYDGTEAFSNVAQVYMEMLVLGDPSPNPVLESGSVFVDVMLDNAQDVEVLLIDGNGSIVKREVMDMRSGAHRMEIDCMNLTRGLYHLRLTANKESYHRTFVIESTK